VHISQKFPPNLLYHVKSECSKLLSNCHCCHRN